MVEQVDRAADKIEVEGAQLAEFESSIPGGPGDQHLQKEDLTEEKRKYVIQRPFWVNGELVTKGTMNLRPFAAKPYIDNGSLLDQEEAIKQLNLDAAAIGAATQPDGLAAMQEQMLAIERGQKELERQIEVRDKAVEAAKQEANNANAELAALKKQMEAENGKKK